MGLGFHAGLYIPVSKRVCINPGITFNFGHHQYEKTAAENGGEEDAIRDTYYFHIFSGNINVIYDLLKLKNGWNIGVMAGISKNRFKADSEMAVESQSYWGAQMGIRSQFLDHKNLGLQICIAYNMPFESDLFAYLTARAGIIYKFR